MLRKQVRALGFVQVLGSVYASGAVRAVIAVPSSTMQASGSVCKPTGADVVESVRVCRSHP